MDEMEEGIRGEDRGERAAEDWCRMER